MPRPPRRRRDADDDEPKTSRYRDDDADDGDDEDEDDERPARRGRSRGRGELPKRGRSRDDDEDEDEKPSRRSRRSRDADDEDDDEDEKPRRSRRSSRDDDEDDDEPRGRRGRRSRGDDEDDEDEKPKRGRRSSRDEEDDEDEDEPRRGRRASRSSNRGRDRGRGRSRDEDDDDEPAPRAKGKRGWDSWKKQKASTFQDDDFKVEEDAPEVLVKFLDDEPFHSYRQHWVEGLRSTNRKSFLCLKDVGEDCPLCDAGAEVRSFAAFNIAVLDDDGNTVIKVWRAGSGVADKLSKKAEAKTGPLTKEYYAVSSSKSGANKKGPVQYEIEVVRERDVEKEWGIDPLTDDDLDALEEKLFDETYFKYPKRQELRAIAREWGRDED